MRQGIISLTFMHPSWSPHPRSAPVAEGASGPAGRVGGLGAAPAAGGSGSERPGTSGCGAGRRARLPGFIAGGEAADP